MKRLLIALSILLLVINVNAQEAMTYSKVIEAPGKDAKTLYQNAKAWFATINDHATVVQFDDPSQLMINATSYIPYYHSGIFYVSYTGRVIYKLIVQCKDGRLRIIMTDIEHRNKPGNAVQSNLGLIMNTEEQFTSGMQKKLNNNVVNDIKEKMKVTSNATFDLLEKFIKSSTSVVNDEW